MNRFVHTRIELPEIALFWNNALSRRNFRHSLGRQHSVLYFMPLKVSIFLGNEGRSDVFHQTGFAVVMISSRKMHKNREKRKYFILLKKTAARKIEECSLHLIFMKRDLFEDSLLLKRKTCFSLTHECLRIAQKDLEEHNWQIPHQDRSFYRLKYSLCALPAVYCLFHPCKLSLLC